MLSTAARLWAGLVGPIGPAPRPARRAENAHVVVALLYQSQKLGLPRLVEQVVGGATHENIDLGEFQADAGGLTHR